MFVYIHRNGTAVVAVDLMEDLGAEGALLGLLAGGYFYSYAFMQLPTGMLSDSWGVRKTVAATTMIAGIGSIFFGMALDVEMAIIGRVIVGIGVSTVYVCGLKFISQWYRKDEFATMNGVFIALGGVGLLMSTMPLAFLSDQFGWRAPFLIIGLISLLLGVAMFHLARDSPTDMGFEPIHAHRERPTNSSLFKGFRRIVTTWEFWPPSIWLFCSMSIYISFGGLWGGPYLIHMYGMSKVEAGRVLSSIAFGMILGSPFLGYLSDKILRKRRIVVVFCAALLMLDMGLMAMFVDSLPTVALYACFFGMGMFAIGINPLIYASIKDAFPLELSGTSTGLANFFPFIGGAIFQPFLGYMLERGGMVGDAYTAEGYGGALVVLLLIAVVGFVATVLLKERPPHHS
ncbi:MAG TPA: MFS transporter [Candidatus Methanofastidiosa archaeon]|nr:MFS transporter [Candidatus Methanofastidiosa archaeon]